MAENIDSQLKRMMQDIKDIISHINTSNVNAQESDDPVKISFELYKLILNPDGINECINHVIYLYMHLETVFLKISYLIKT